MDELNKKAEFLSLPKKAIETAMDFISKIFGPAADQVGGILGDQLKYYRLKQWIRINSKAAKLLEGLNVEPSQLPIKVVLPLLEKASIEDDPDLQDMWAKLLANMSLSITSGLEVRMIDVMSQMTNLDARIFEFMYREFEINRREVHKFKRLQSSRYLDIENVPSELVVVLHDEIEIKFEDESEFVKISLENLKSIGLITENREVEIDYDNSTMDGSVIIDANGARVIDAGNYSISEFGKYFHRHSCVDPKSNINEK